MGLTNGMPGKIKLHCLWLQCSIDVAPALDLNLIHEDEEVIQWSGACATCGREFHLTHTKEATDEGDNSGERVTEQLC